MWYSKVTCIILLFFVCWGNYAQDYSTKLEGRVFSSDGDVAATHVSNMSLKKGTITNAAGYFTISVRLNDTLVFSAVQYKRKVVIVTLKIVEGELLKVKLENSLTELDEVVVTPYNLSGDLKRDMGNMEIEPLVTASTLGLPNAYVKVKTQNERKLFEADNGKFVTFGNYKLDSTFNPMVMINLNKILNRVTGRTQMIKRHIVIDEDIILLQKMKKQFPDSVYVQDLKIPELRINDFMNFCEVDSTYVEVMETDDALRIWE